MNKINKRLAPSCTTLKVAKTKKEIGNWLYLPKAQLRKAGIALAQVGTSCLPPTIS